MAQASPSVYVGDLDQQVTEALLYDHFKNCGPVVSVRVCMDSQTHKSLGYGYVNFQNVADADTALENMNGSKLLNRNIRVARIQRDPTARKAGVTNLVVKNLPPEVDMVALKEMFGSFGKITSIRVATDESGKSRGYAYVMFESEECVLKAVEEVNGQEIDGTAIVVERYRPLHRAEQLEKFCNLYVKGLSKKVSEEAFRELFAKFGEITSLKIRTDPETNESMGYGYVAFKEHGPAQECVDQLNGKTHELAAEGEELCVRRFESKKERTRKHEIQWRERQAQYAKFPNLYVKNLEDHVTTEQLQEVFEAHGSTESARVMRDKETGISKGFGFVSFKDHASAQKAIAALAGSTVLGSRPLYVTYALKRDARRQQFEEMQKKRAQRSMNMGGYGPQGGNYGPQGGQGGFPGANPMSRMQPQQNMMMQLAMQRQAMGGGGQGQFPGGMPGGANMMQPQRMMRPQPKPQGMVQPPMAQPQQPQPQQAQSLSTLLANMSTEQQKNVLGERLYAHISKGHSSEAAKITGMLLEMDNAEILNLLEAPAQLDEKVNEALDVLHQHSY